MTRRSAPAAAASAATSSIPGVSTTGSSSFGTAFVAGRNRVPSPAAGTMAVLNVWVVAAPVMGAKPNVRSCTRWAMST